MERFVRLVGRDVLFAHWPIDPDDLRPHVPDPLALDTYDEDAWLGVVALDVAEAGTRPLPVRRSFPILNCRTYVRVDSDPGVYFLTVDAGDRLAGTLGRRVFGLPVRRAEVAVDRRRADVEFRSRRSSGPRPARFEARYRPDGDPFRAEPGSIEDVLIERKRFYVPGRDRAGRSSRRKTRLRVGEIDRDPWRLYPASVRLGANTLFRAIGIDASLGDPFFRYSPELVTTAEPPEPIARTEWQGNRKHAR